MKVVLVGRILVALTLVYSINLRAQSRVPAGSKVPSWASVGFNLKVDVNLVLVEATVRDEHGAAIENLRRENFHLLEDGVEQEIRYFSRDELPLAVALVLDRSGSMGPVLKELRRTAYRTLSSLKPDDQVVVFDFAARPEQVGRLTKDRQRIADDISQIHAAGGTVITDALYEAASYLSRAAPSRRHAIILVSDNENTLKGYTNESQVIHQALETETVIYSIKIEEGMYARQMYVMLPIFRDVSVPKITRETGGEIIEARNARTIQAAMATVIGRLKQRYSLGYYSTNNRRDGAFRQIEIRIDDSHSKSSSPNIVYARRGYYAPADTQP